MRLLQSFWILLILHQICGEKFERRNTQNTRIQDFNIPVTATNVVLSYNKKITRLYSGDFAGLNQVTSLSLEACEIDTIENGAFEGLSALKNLILAVNKITVFPDLRGMPMLEQFSLFWNKLTEIPDDVLVEENNVIWRIQLHKNEITGVADGFVSKFPNLKNLILASNKMTSVPNVHSSSSLEYLDLKTNRFTEIKAASFESQPAMNLKKLEISNMDSSPVTIEDQAFSVLTNLEELRIDNMELTELPDLQANLRKLRILSIQNNNLTTVNPRKFFGNMINYNQESAMKTMYFNYNDISQISGEFLAAFTNLETLQFIKNSLETFPMASLKNLAKLRWVYLESNKLTTVPSIGHSGQNQLRIVVAGNPLICDYRLCWLFQSGYMYYNPSRVDDFKFPCEEPMNKRTITWDEFNIDDLDCSAAPTTTATEPSVTEDPGEATTSDNASVGLQFSGLTFCTTIFVLLHISKA